MRFVDSLAKQPGICGDRRGPFNKVLIYTVPTYLSNRADRKHFAF